MVYNNTIYIPGETITKEVNVTDSNGNVQTIIVTNTTYTILELPLIYFPHLIGAGICSLISLGGYLKDRNHALITNIIALVGPIELIAYGV